MKSSLKSKFQFGVLALFATACGSAGDGSGSSAGSGADANSAAGAGASAAGSSNSGSGGESPGTGGNIAGTGAGQGSSGTGSAPGGGIYTPPEPVPIDYTPSGSFSEGELTCDGVDNDNNGIVDDVDLGQDGICDCLRIATLGRAGPWGASTVFSQWLDTRGANAAVDLGDQVLTSELLAPYQVIVALDVSTVAIRARGITYPISHTYAPSEAAAMEGWIRDGGGLMTTIGYTSNEALEVVNINTLTAFSNLTYSTTLTNTEGNVQLWAMHPVTDGMGVARIQNGTQPGGTAGQEIGWDIGNRVALKVHTPDMGRIAMWGDEWITYDAYWNNDRDLDIELLWLNLLKWLTPPKECQVPIPPIVR